MTYALMLCNYSPLKANISYKVIQEGFDWVKVKHDGKPVMVSKSLVHPDPISALYDLPEEDIYDESLDTYNTIFM
jgi:hypothetical protein|tara:strand:- start:336 stop:560 length:225 start_codon:yes stop_codon:yes gene_type:complete